jgi:pimeloyl-ACP methyl ester carboxylesterase
MEDARLILPDLRGHGRSRAPECCYTRIDLAYDMKLLLDHLGLAAVGVVGHSLGSMVAFTLAARWPERVTRLVLESSSVRAGERSGWLLDNVRRLADPIDPLSPFMREWFGNPGAVDPVFLDHMRHEAAAIPALVWRAVLSDLMGYDAQALLADVTAPTLILHGAQDPLMTEAGQADLRAALRHAAFRSFPAFGHNPHWEDPRLVAEVIRTFVAQAW